MKVLPKKCEWIDNWFWLSYFLHLINLFLNMRQFCFTSQSQYFRHNATVAKSIECCVYDSFNPDCIVLAHWNVTRKFCDDTPLQAVRFSFHKAESQAVDDVHTCSFFKRVFVHVRVWCGLDSNPDLHVLHSIDHYTTKGVSAKVHVERWTVAFCKINNKVYVGLTALINRIIRGSHRLE